MSRPRRIRRVYPDTAAQARTRVIATLRAAVGDGLDNVTAEQVLRTAGGFDHIGLRQLDQDLAVRPDALRSSIAHGSSVTVRVAHALAAAGHDVVLPRCVGCGRITVELRRPTSQGRSCEWCVARQVLRICARCHELGHPVAQRPEGAICRRCYNADEHFVRPCAGCGRERPPTVRTAEGGVLCWACAPRAHRDCARCGRESRIHANTADGSICRRCYRHPRRACGRCARVAPIAIRARDGEPDLCHRCRTDPLHQCGFCNNLRPVSAIWPIGPVCRACYRHARRRPTNCGRCGELKVLLGRGDDGQLICGPCSGVDVDFACRVCHQVNDYYSDSTCAQCVLAERVPRLLTGPDGKISPQLQPLAEVLTAARRPDSVLRWLYRYSGSFLPELAAATPPITHATLDNLPQPRRLDHLRLLMVHAGVLPPRVEHLERIPPWIEDLLAHQPTQHQLLVRPFAHWAVLRAARRAAARGRYPLSRATHDRSAILTALRLLDWIDQRNLTLSTFTQTHLEDWLSQHATYSAQAALIPFVTWTNQRRLTSGLHIPQHRIAAPSVFLDSGLHLAQLRRCLHDDKLPLEVRIIGALLLLYGTTVSRIADLTTDHIIRRRTATFLSLNRAPVLLPTSLARLLDQLLITPALGSALTHTRRLLFPGRIPSRPRDTGTIVRHLNQHGLHARAARNTALISLAADLPAAILADLLGLHPTTAVRWARLSNSDWSAYLAAAPARSDSQYQPSAALTGTNYVTNLGRSRPGNTQPGYAAHLAQRQ